MPTSSKFWRADQSWLSFSTRKREVENDQNRATKLWLIFLHENCFLQIPSMWLPFSIWLVLVRVVLYCSVLYCIECNFHVDNSESFQITSRPKAYVFPFADRASPPSLGNAFVFHVPKAKIVRDVTMYQVGEIYLGAILMDLNHPSTER